MLKGKLRLRQVTRLMDNGHQTPILTSRRDLPAAQVAYRMFDRWRQENFFKYLREEYALDALGADPYQSFAGCSRSGFQSVMPISPDLCLFVYDASVYKAGARQQRLVQIPKDDLEIMNSLQVQSAEESLYFHEPKMEQEVQNLIARYARLRYRFEICSKKYPVKYPVDVT